MVFSTEVERFRQMCVIWAERSTTASRLTGGSVSGDKFTSRSPGRAVAKRHNPGYAGHHGGHQVTHGVVIMIPADT